MRILLLQLKRIGDLILTTPALVGLREAFPDAEVTLVIGESCKGLVPLLPGVDHVWEARSNGFNAALIKQICLSKFDVCLDFTGNDRSAFFTALSGAKRRIALSVVKRVPFRPFVYNEFLTVSLRETHTVDLVLEFLKPLGVNSCKGFVTLSLPAEAERRAGEILEALGVKGRFAIAHPGTARAEKYWLPERWAAVIDACQGVHGIPCLVTGTRKGMEGEHIQRIQAALKTPFLDLTDRLDLATLAALIKRADLLMSMDSAPVHFGAAFKTRQVALFGETNPFHWHPRHDKAAILFAGFPKPLSEFTPRFTRRPLSDLSTQTVLDSISPLLSKNGKTA
jgi:ADP-heptose:LPS heptosyltransferase